ncbi:MAG: DedA family protein [Myxococcota bacterium]|jgi:membrane protein DedA with SNARE-associated domain|nr:DedA family protein [Myxococcota bacterium]
MLDAILEALAANENALGFAILCGACALEYVFPPFPGDTVLLLGGVLAATHGWSALFVLCAATLGAVLGSSAIFYVSLRLAQQPESRLSRWLFREKVRRASAALVERFARHGAAFIVVNRFLPGIRSFFFVAAGLAKMPSRAVLGWGALSALAWNALVILAGYLLGGQLERLQTLLTRYTMAVWALLGSALVLWLGWKLLKRRPSNESTAPIDDKPLDRK